jgi:chorismate mutase
MKKPCFYLALGLLILAAGSLKAQSSPQKPLNILDINRKKIDSIDEKTIELIGEREKWVREIGIYKAEKHIAPLQTSRFQEVLKNAIQAGAKQGLSAAFVTKLMNAVHEESLRIENEIKASHS